MDFKTIAGFLSGMLVGVTVGVLLAPESGKALRRKILNEADAMAKELMENLEIEEPIKK